MSRSGLTFRALVAVAAVAVLVSVALAQGTASPGKKAEDEYMNIQVLKGVPADQVVPAMQFISNALNADCEFCHVRGSFDKDDKEEKKTAREMIKMMNEINKANFDGHKAVTCFTCHHGSTNAKNVPEIPDTEPKPPQPPVKPESLPAAQALLDKYVAAVGGADALAKVKSRYQKGTMSGFGGRTMAVEIFAKAPDKRASYVQMGQGANITAFDGKNGWLGNPGRPARDMSPDEAAHAKMDADLTFASDVKKMYTKFDVAPSDKVNGHDVWMVIARNEGQPPLRLYLDQQSGLLVRLQRYIETPLGRNPTQIDYDDYKDDGGVKVAQTWTVARPQGRFTIKVDETKTNVDVDDAKFAKPADAPKPEGPKPPDAPKKP